MPPRPTCECGSCPKCLGRAATARSRKKRGGWRSAREWLDRAKPRASSNPAIAVAWHPDLTELRRALPPGSAVGVGGRGVTIDRVGADRLHFDSIEAALDWATRP